jgi:hypothetical protein
MYLVCDICKFNLDEEKLKRAGLAQQNGFSPAVSQRLLRLVNGHSEVKYRPEKSVINMM